MSRSKAPEARSISLRKTWKSSEQSPFHARRAHFGIIHEIYNYVLLCLHVVLWVTQNHFITAKHQWHQTCSFQHDLHREHGGKESRGRAFSVSVHWVPPQPPPPETWSWAPGRGGRARVCTLGRVVMVVVVVVVVFVVVVVLVALDHGH